MISTADFKTGMTIDLDGEVIDLNMRTVNVYITRTVDPVFGGDPDGTKTCTAPSHVSTKSV